MMKESRDRGLTKVVARDAVDNTNYRILKARHLLCIC